jgi:hypothetical protein
MPFDTLEEDRCLSNHEIHVQHMGYDRLAPQLKQHAAYWNQWNKFRVVREADNNTSFFHAHAFG